MTFDEDGNMARWDIERYQRRESSVEEALIEMYLAGVSVRRVEDITEALWGTRVSPGTVSNLNKKIYAKIDEWRHRPIEGDHPYVFLDGIVMKRTWAGEVRNVSLLVAIGVTSDGHREILGIVEGPKEDKSGWSAFLRHLAEQLGLATIIIRDAVRLVVTTGIIRALTRLILVKIPRLAYYLSWFCCIGRYPCRSVR